MMGDGGFGRGEVNFSRRERENERMKSKNKCAGPHEKAAIAQIFSTKPGRTRKKDSKKRNTTQHTHTRTLMFVNKPRTSPTQKYISLSLSLLHNTK